MSCFRKILVAYDGSTVGEIAVTHAAYLARDQNARLTILAVAPHVPVSGWETSGPPDLRIEYARILRRAAASIGPEISVTTNLRGGHPAESIVRAAREGGHDLIVMGSHGHGRLHRAVLGSISTHVVRRVSVPVLLVNDATTCLA
jgi:nucleotide-binding universal stress UspA family protein